MAAAYTYRPTSSTEILKKKRDAKQAAGILTFIQENYSSGIVLQPNTNFKKIKVLKNKLRNKKNKYFFLVLLRLLIGHLKNANLNHWHYQSILSLVNLLYLIGK